MVNEKEVREKLGKVIDPELGVDIVNLGFIYEIKISEKEIVVVMTLTTPGCPLVGTIEKMVKTKVAELPRYDIDDVRVELTFDPPWTQEMMSEEAKLELGFI